jgi:microcystin-dependent protein
MAQPFLAEIRIFAFTFAPKGWAMCNGQSLPISQNQALFAVLGTAFGGNGQTTFNLPNLQGGFPMHITAGFTIGATGGESAHSLIMAEIPNHSHAVFGSSTAANTGNPTGNLWATGNDAYNTSTNATMSGAAIIVAGQGQPHENKPPYLTLNFCIALQGIFPSRN